jgi:hypothetical protein|tara:strand:+ start:2261 stop:2416 length:156 start_codon:yes stop_codon:yes gene_type:complete
VVANIKNRWDWRRLKAAQSQASCPFLKQSDGSGIEVLDKSHLEAEQVNNGT